MEWMWLIAWHFISWTLIVFLIVMIFLSIIMLIILRRKKKNMIILPSSIIIISILLLIGSVLYIESHATFFRYNDWYIVGNSKEKVEDKYGIFHFDYIENDGSGVAVYKGVDWSELYCMKYNEQGIITSVYMEREDN